MSFGDNLRLASQSLEAARTALRSASNEAEDAGSKDRKSKAYELELLSEETLDIYDRLLSIMHALDIPHTE